MPNTSPARDVVLKAADEGERLWVLGDHYTFKIGSDETAGAYAVLETITAPGNPGPPPHRHHDCDESFQVLEGQLELWVEGQTKLAGPGSFVSIPKGTLHTFKNAGATPARFLVFLSPGGFDKFFQELGDPVTDPNTPPEGPVDVPKVVAVAAKYNCEIPPPPDA